MPQANPDGPLPGDLILHTCGGRARLWLQAGHYGCCAVCRAPMAGDVDYLPGHAHYFCTRCQRMVGLCSAPLFGQIEDGARRVLLSADRAKRRQGKREP